MNGKLLAVSKVLIVPTLAKAKCESRFVDEYFHLGILATEALCSHASSTTLMVQNCWVLSSQRARMDVTGHECLASIAIVDVQGLGWVTRHMLLAKLRLA
eukprot:5265640-Amphidinium_carterae.1